MKRIIIILFLLSGLILNAATYYVAPSTATPAGNDAAAGTIGAPWLTWAKAFRTAQAGDTVFFRGGVYPHTVTSGAGLVIDARYPATNGYSGTAGNYICYFNYPGEVPILDCSNITAPTTNYPSAINIRHTKYLHFKGLTIRNYSQKDEYASIDTWKIQYDSDFIITENCTIHDVAGVAFHVSNPSTSAGLTDIRYINCDAYNCCDTLHSYAPGQYGSGFTTANVVHDAMNVYYYGCRAWNCSDQGFAGRSFGYVEIDSCWAFRNGALAGDGHGFKPSPPDTYRAAPTIQRAILNCISAYNEWSGFNTNDNGKPAARLIWYNNIAYHNGYAAQGGDAGTGFRLLGAASYASSRILRNNIAYANELRAVSSATYTHSNNTWDASVTVSDIDFVSLDSTGLTGARQADGSLPVLNFLKLASTSDLIDAGIDVTPYHIAEGNAPDLGPYEYGQAAPPAAPQISTLTPYNITIDHAITGGYMIFDGGGTISAKGICFGTHTNPDLTDNVISGGTGVSDFIINISGLTPNVIYHCRAYATNENGTTYGADEQFTTSQSSIIKHAGKIVKR
jgi:hypothetical protein